MYNVYVVMLAASKLRDINRSFFYLHYVRYKGIIRVMGYDFHFDMMIGCDYAWNIASVKVSCLV